MFGDRRGCSIIMSSCYSPLWEEPLWTLFCACQSRAGMISTVEVLKLMEAFVNEPNYTVWSDLSCNLGVLSSLLSHTDFHEEIQEFIRDLFTPVGLKLGWDSKPGEGGEELVCLSQRLPSRQDRR